MNKHDLATQNAQTLSFFMQCLWSEDITPFVLSPFGEKVFIIGSSKPSGRDDEGSDVYNVTLSGEHYKAEYKVTLDLSLEPRIIETGSYMLHCDFKGVNDKHTELVVGIISKFSVAIENLVLEHHIDIESDFAIWETSKPTPLQAKEPSRLKLTILVLIFYLMKTVMP